MHYSLGDVTGDIEVMTPAVMPDSYVTPKPTWIEEFLAGTTGIIGLIMQPSAIPGVLAELPAGLATGHPKAIGFAVSIGITGLIVYSLISNLGKGKR